MRAEKYARWNWRDVWRLPAVVLILAPAVRENYRQRELRRAPDEWYWADILLMEWGYRMTEEPYSWLRRR